MAKTYKRDGEAKINRFINTGNIIALVIWALVFFLGVYNVLGNRPITFFLLSWSMLTVYILATIKIPSNQYWMFNGGEQLYIVLANMLINTFRKSRAN